MPNSKQIVYLSQAQYAELIANGSITVDGVTVNYDENDIYVTPQASPITDVKINGMSIGNNGTANVPIATDTTLGVIKRGTGLYCDSNGRLIIDFAGDYQIRDGATLVTTPVSKQHQSVFYGLAKAAGHDEKDSTEPLGTYTPEAKGAIQKMLGVSDLIATEENNLIASKAYKVGDVFTANGKLYKATSAIAVDGAIIVDGENANCVETNVGEGFVKKTDIATYEAPGLLKVHPYLGLFIDNQGQLCVDFANSTQIKSLIANNKIISLSQFPTVLYYGLSKLAGVDLANETVTLGTYPDNAKSAIRTMLGATSSNVIAVQDTQPTDTDTKIWLPETAETPVEVPTVAEMEQALAGKVGDVQVDGTSVVSNGIATIPIANEYLKLGLVKVENNFGIKSNAGRLYIDAAGLAHSKAGTDVFRPVTPFYQHNAVFYGLAKAAGDTTQSASDNAVGTYTDEAKQAIRTMLGAVGTEDYATASTAGIVRVHPQYGLTMVANDAITIQAATDAELKAGATGYKPISPHRQHIAAFYGLAKAAGDTTQSASSNTVGNYTDNAKASIKAMLGIQDGSTGTVDISGTDPVIAAVENTRYVCGEVTSLNFTPPASGISIVRFTSSSTVTVLTLPSTVKFPEWFDSTSLETNTIYEICVTDGEFGAVMSWPL